MVKKYNKHIIKTRQIIENQQQFEQLITDIASKIAQTKPDQFEAVINEVLRILGQFFHVRMAFLAQFSTNLNKLHFTNIWVDELIRSDTDLSGLSNEEQLSQRLESYGITDGIVVPICVEGKLVGLLGLDAFTSPCEYPLANADRLQIIANMIGSMIIRIQKTNPYCE